MALLPLFRSRGREAELEHRVYALQTALDQCKGVARSWWSMRVRFTVAVALVAMAAGFALGVYRHPIKQAFVDTAVTVGLASPADGAADAEAAFQILPLILSLILGLILLLILALTLGLILPATLPAILSLILRVAGAPPVVDVGLAALAVAAVIAVMAAAGVGARGHAHHQHRRKQQGRLQHGSRPRCSRP